MTCCILQTLLTLDETGDEEDHDEKSESVGMTQSTKRKRSDDTGTVCRR